MLFLSLKATYGKVLYRITVYESHNVFFSCMAYHFTRNWYIRYSWLNEKQKQDNIPYASISVQIWKTSSKKQDLKLMFVPLLAGIHCIPRLVNMLFIYSTNRNWKAGSENVFGPSCAVYDLASVQLIDGGLAPVKGI